MERFASKDECRPALQSVRITPEYTEATDGHVAVRVLNEPNGIAPEDFPKVDGCDPTVTFPNYEPGEGGKLPGFLLPVGAAKKITKAIPTNGKLPCLRRVAFDPVAESFAVTDLETPTTYRPREVEGTYPNVDAIWPKGEPVLTVAFNAKILGPVLAFMAEHTEKGQHKIELDLYDPNSAMVVRAIDEDTRQEMKAIVMPLRVDK